VEKQTRGTENERTEKRTNYVGGTDRKRGKTMKRKNKKRRYDHFAMVLEVIQMLITLYKYFCIP